jgi:hypothetical protein
MVSAASWLADAAKRFGIALTSSEIKSFIEAAVYDLNVAQGKKVAPPAVTTPGV